MVPLKKPITPSNQTLSKSPFENTVETVFSQILIFLIKFFIFSDRFDVLISKIIFFKNKNIILMYF